MEELPQGCKHQTHALVFKPVVITLPTRKISSDTSSGLQVALDTHTNHSEVHHSLLHCQTVNKTHNSFSILVRLRWGREYLSLPLLYEAHLYLQFPMPPNSSFCLPTPPPSTLHLGLGPLPSSLAIANLVSQWTSQIISHTAVS